MSIRPRSWAGKRHQPGPDAGHRGHHHLRFQLRGQGLPAHRRHLLSLHLPQSAASAGLYRRAISTKELVEGYEKKSGNHIVATTYYGTRQTTSNRRIQKCSDMQGLKIARARRAGLPGNAAGLRRHYLAHRLRRGLPGAAERHGGSAGEPAHHHRGQEVLRGAEGHRPRRRISSTT